MAPSAQVFVSNVVGFLIILSPLGRSTTVRTTVSHIQYSEEAVVLSSEADKNAAILSLREGARDVVLRAASFLCTRNVRCAASLLSEPLLDADHGLRHRRRPIRYVLVRVGEEQDVNPNRPAGGARESGGEGKRRGGW